MSIHPQAAQKGCENTNSLTGTVTDRPEREVVLFRTLTLVVLILLAVTLAFSLPGDRVARALFDSPPPTETPTPTATPTETPESAATGTAEPTAEPTLLLTQTITPEATAEEALPTPATPAPGDETQTPAPETPTPAEPASVAPVAPGFLPPPTLTSPDALGPGGFPSLRPNSGLPLAGPAAPLPAPAPKPETALSDVPSAAQLIDNGVVALSYLWLCCGVFFLIGATLGLVWLVRRSRRRSRDAGTPQP